MTKTLITLSLILTSTLTYTNDCPPDKIGSFCDSKFVVSNQTLRDLVNGETVISKNGNVAVNSYADYIIDTRYVTDMSGLFKNTNPKYSIRHWNTENVTDMSTMFYKSKSFNQDISDWNVGRLENAKGMFFKAHKFNQDISKWNIQNVRDMSSFLQETNAFNKNLSNWNVDNVINCYLFAEHLANNYKPDFKAC